MKNELNKIKAEFLREIDKVKNSKELENIKVAYLGRKGFIAEVFKNLKSLSGEVKKDVGRDANILKNEIEQKINEKVAEVAGDINEFAEKKLGIGAVFDVSAPSKRIPLGSRHPITLVREEAEKIFSSMGFEVAEGPEAETEYNNFDALNIPKNHPARDMWDTFWLDNKKGEKLLLRTHTSPVQIRYMKTHKPPFRIIAPGRTFRYEATDARHDIQFYQLEGLMIGKDISLANLKAVIEVFLSRFFHTKTEVRFLPSYFPFVEPGVEVEAACFLCAKEKSEKRCPVCGGSGWFEIMGAGMVHRAVLEEVGISSAKWQGFAFGVGLDRLALLKYKIDDIRLLYGADIRFLKQFK